MELYFRDNFFNAGYTEIMDGNQEQAGHLDLKSLFGSSLDVFGPEGLICSGRFGMLSNRWDVTSVDGRHLGVLRARMSFLVNDTNTMLDREESMKYLHRHFPRNMMSREWAAELWLASDARAAGSVQELLY